MQVKSGALCNAGHCEPALMVSGYLDEGFVTRFAATAEDQIKSAKWICIDSPGGKPSEGLVLAKFLQVLGKQTCVAPIRRPDATLQATKCASSCALAFAGGARRVLADDHSLGVHRAFLNDGAACIPCNYVASPLIHWIELFMRPDDRRAWMRFQDSIDRELDPDLSSEAATLSVDSYVSFVVDHIDQLGEKWIEGKFAQSLLGRQVWEALMWITKDEEDISDPDERSRMFDELNRIMDNHPHNPYPGALLVSIVGLRFAESWGEMLDDESDLPEADMACALWLYEIAKKSIGLFQSTIPKTFRGTIEPKLVGRWIENHSYHSVLHYGGIAASAAGMNKEAKRWFRQSIKTCKQDPFGSRFWL